MLIKIPFYKTFVFERQKNIFFNKTLFCLYCRKQTTLYKFFPGTFNLNGFPLHLGCLKSYLKSALIVGYKNVESFKTERYQKHAGFILCL